MGISCPSLITIDDNSNAGKASSITSGAVQSLNDILVGEIPGNIVPGELNSQLASVVNSNSATLPDSPDIDDLSNSSVESPPGLTPIRPISLGTLPTFNAKAPSGYVESPSTPKSISAPETPVINTEINLPSAPNADDLHAPALNGIKIPIILPLDIPDFSADKPIASIIQPPGASFSFTDEAYTSDVISQMEVRMGELANNEVGIPDIIWNSIWRQDQEREQESVNQLLDDIDIDTGARGFMLPNGVQLHRMDTARQKALTVTISQSREVAIQHSKDRVDNLRFHVQQGIALENMRGQWHQDAMNRLLDSSKYAFTSAIELFNADINYFNAQLALFKAEAEVYMIQVQAEVAKLDSQKIELEAQKLVSEINKDAIAIYNGEIEAINTKALIYKSNVDAALATLEGAKIDVSIYAANINKFGEQIKESLSIYEKYKTAAQIKETEASIYESSASAFNAQVNGYKAGAEAQSEINKAIAIENDSKVKLYDSIIKEFTANIQADASRLDSKTKVFDSEVKAYGISANVNQFADEIRVKQQTNQIQYASDLTKASIAQAQHAVQIVMSNSRVAADRMNAIMQSNSALSAAALSTVHYGTTMSMSNSRTCTSSTRYDGGKV